MPNRPGVEQWRYQPAQLRFRSEMQIDADVVQVVGVRQKSRKDDAQCIAQSFAVAENIEIRNGKCSCAGNPGAGTEVLQMHVDSARPAVHVFICDAHRVTVPVAEATSQQSVWSAKEVAGERRAIGPVSRSPEGGLDTVKTFTVIEGYPNRAVYRQHWLGPRLKRFQQP